MCISATTMLALQVGGTLLQGYQAKKAANAQAAQLEYEAAGERDAGQAQAERILRATSKERGAARAQIAANGTALDDFALINEHNIQEAGELDAAMAILTGERRARTLKTQAGFTRTAGSNAMTSSLLRGAYTAMGGWKGAKDPIPPINDDGYGQGLGGAYGGNRRGL